MKKSAYQINTKAMNDFENKFISKIKLAKNLPNYDLIKDYAENCIYNHTGVGFSAIQTQVIMSKINNMPNDEFIEWAKTVI